MKKIKKDFLVIDNNEAVIKTFEKDIPYYENIMELISLTENLRIDTLIQRLSSYSLNNAIHLNELLNNEINSSGGKIDKNEPLRCYFQLPDNPEKETSDEYKEQSLKKSKFLDIRNDLQLMLTKKLKIDLIKKLREFYKNYEQQQIDEFITKSLSKEDVVFLVDYYPTGLSSRSFTTKGIEVIHNSNFNYGNLSFSHLIIKVNNEVLLTWYKPFGSEEYKLDIGKDFSIEEAQAILNDYLSDPIAYKRLLLKTNVKYLKKALENEEQMIEILEEVIIPKLRKKIEKLSNEESYKKVDNKELKKVKDDLLKYTTDNLDKVETYLSTAVTVMERKKRIVFLKSEINRLIKVFKNGEENLMEPV